MQESKGRVGLVLISPFLKLNGRIKDPLIGKNRLKIDLHTTSAGEIGRPIVAKVWVANL